MKITCGRSMTYRCFSNIQSKEEKKSSTQDSLTLSKVSVTLNSYFILGQQEEWWSKDLVVDTRETWKAWAKRQINFEDPPLIPREDLPENY